MRKRTFNSSGHGERMAVYLSARIAGSSSYMKIHNYSKPRPMSAINAS
jgi:hypothetical protein